VNALDVNGGVWMWEYDEYDQLKTTATPADTINYEYENGVLVKVSERGITTEIEWDDQLNPISFAAEGGKEYNKFDRLGRLKTRTDSRMNNWHYKYDLLECH